MVKKRSPPISAYVIYGWYLVLMVVGGIRTTTERGLWKINRTVFQLQLTLLNAPLDATLTKDVWRYGRNTRFWLLQTDNLTIFTSTKTIFVKFFKKYLSTHVKCKSMANLYIVIVQKWFSMHVSPHVFTKNPSRIPNFSCPSIHME